MSTKLPNYLFPKGRSDIEPDLMPNVLDSDGNPVLFTSVKRKTTEGTVVDLGSSPNSNNGDPLRTSFAKVNNFMEAVYWWDEGINQKFRDIDSELREGIFIYLDSETGKDSERYNISLLDNSKLFFKGTQNQIELSGSRTHSPNNPYDFDSEVFIRFQLTETVDISTLNVKEHATFDSDVTMNGNLVVADHVELGGHVRMKESLTVDSDVFFSADLRVDSDVYIKGELTVGENVLINDDLRVKGYVQFDSDVSIGGGVSFGKEVTFDDDVTFTDNVHFDSDVVIAGSLTVKGTTTTVNTQNLEVNDNVIVLNTGQTVPFNDIGLIFQRWDSDAVSAANFNTALIWDEQNDQFAFGQSSSSGITSTPTLTQQYMHIGQTVEFFDSDNTTRMIWDKSHARLSILNKDGTEAFAFDADSGQMEGNGTIDAGLY